MLVLSRRVGQRLMIGNDISVTITRLQGNRVRVAIEAPRSQIIRRCELPPEGPPDKPAVIFPEPSPANAA